MDRQRTYRLFTLCAILCFIPIFSYALGQDGEAGWPSRQKLWLGVIDEKSMAYNRDGYAAYTKKNYEAAASAFESAIKRDYDNCFAHYNLACVLSLLYGKSMRGEDAIDKIVLHLSKAAELDSHWLERIFVDSDFNPIRKKAVKAGFSIPGPVDSRFNYSFFPDGTVGVGRSFDDLRGPMEGEEAAEPAPQEPPKFALVGRYCILENRVLAVIPGLDSYNDQYPGMGYEEETAEKENHAGSPGMDFTWLFAALDSKGNVQEIYPYR